MKFPTIYWNADDEGAGAAGDPPPAAAGLFDPSKATEQAEAKEWDGPDWVYDQFRTAENPIEAQAKSYAEALKKINTKTEDLRTELRADEAFRKEIADSLADPDAPKPPETADAYAYPEGIEAPAETVDKAFKDWAHKNKVPQDAFNELVALYGQTLPNLEAERAKLGDNVDARTAAMNNWGAKNIPAELHGAAAKVMQTAEGFELFEAMMMKMRDSGYSPAGGTPPAPQTENDIREMMNDPRYYDDTKRDMSYVKKVDDAWQRFFARPGK